MNVHAGLLAQKMKRLLNLSAILAAANQLRDLLVERLNADFKLQRAGRKPGADLRAAD
jgi:hypothetical protein